MAFTRLISSLSLVDSLSHSPLPAQSLPSPLRTFAQSVPTAPRRPCRSAWPHTAVAPLPRKARTRVGAAIVVHDGAAIVNDARWAFCT